MWTVERIEKLCIEYCGRCNVIFDSPVKINGRLTKTLGRCFYEKTGSTWNPIRIEISKHLLETATDKSIEEVIMHECAHYVTCAITHEHHGHDKTFRYYCDKIGTTNNSVYYDDIEYKKPEKMVYKYTLRCAGCGQTLGGRHRACKITKNPQFYVTKCCGASVEVIQNW